MYQHPTISRVTAIPVSFRGYPALTREQLVTLLAWAASAAVLGVVVPLALFDRSNLNALEWTVMLAWLVTLYSACHLGALVAKGRERLLSITFWVYVYLWLGLVPLLQVSAGTFPWPGHYGSGVIRTALTITLSGLVAFDLGVSLCDRFRRHDPLDRQAWALATRRVPWMAAASLVLGLLIIAYLGGLRELILSRAQFATQLTNVSGGGGRAGSLLLHALLKVPPFITWLALACMWRDSRKGLRPPLSRSALMLLGAMTLANVVINNPLTSHRAWFGTVVLSSLFVLIPWRNRWSSAAWVYGLVTMFVVIFPYADLFRLTVQARVSGIKIQSLASQLVDNGDYASFQQMANAVLYVGDEGFSKGRQFLGSMLVFVPRKIWENKPLDTADLVAGHIGYAYKNLEMPLWGELYIDGGLIAVILGFALYGYLLARIERRYEFTMPHQSSVIAVITPVYAVHQMFLIRGDLMSAFGWLLPILACCVMLSRHAGLEQLWQRVSGPRISRPHIPALTDGGSR